jgi:hypothetical protein
VPGVALVRLGTALRSAAPSLPTSGETLTIRDLLALRARFGACWDVAGQRTRWGWRRGPVRRASRRRASEVAELRRRAERAEAELQKAKKVIEIQGNVSALLEQMLGTEGESGSTER